jgi:HAE1 family hydrophobic/amphiphilic exporter-1
MLKDVAKVELAQSYTGFAQNGDNPAVSMGIFQTPGSNAQDIINNIKTYLKSAEKIFQTEFIICLILIPMNF